MAQTVTAKSVWYKRATFWGPAIAVTVGLLWFAGAARSPSDPADEMQLTKFGKLPVQDGGRFKPVDTFARVRLMELAKRQNYYQEYTDDKPRSGDGEKEIVRKEKRSAVQWLLNVMADGYAVRVSGIQVPPVVQPLLKLPPRRNHVYSPTEILRKAKEDPEVRRLILAQDPDPRAMALRMVLMEAKDKADAVEEIQKASEKRGLADEMRVFRIENDQVSAMLDLKRQEGLRYTFSEIRHSDEAFTTYRKKALDAQKRKREGKERDLDLEDVKALDLLSNLNGYLSLMALEGGLQIVPSKGEGETWKTLGEAMEEGDADNNPAAKSLEKILDAYVRGDVKTFNKEVDSYTTYLNQRMPREMAKVRTEAWFSHFEPFYHCLILYVVVLLLAVGSWIGWREPLRWSAFWLCSLVFVVHTFALIMRIYLTGRPPVTNLYSSAVFIGWGVVLTCLSVCLMIEVNSRGYRFLNGIILAGAAGLGFATMIVAHHLGTTSGDTMEVMQAVLDTNFWLATQLTTVTLGYAATFLAGFLAMVFVFLMLATAVRSFFATRETLAGAELAWFIASVCALVALPAALVTILLGAIYMLLSDGTPLDLGTMAVLSMPGVAVAGFYAALTISKRLAADYGPGVELPRLVYIVDALALRQETAKALGGLVYGIVCFAMLLSFVGTVLGGIWADQSWGRFWGWDPKENGALLIVIMNALILHARWGGIVKERGLCVLAILGNMVTAWSWFGTNQLGVGLHAYGFNNTLAFGCSVFWVSQICMAVIAAMPLRFWRAYADKPLDVLLAPTKAPKGPRLQSGRGGNTGIQPA